MKFEVGQTVFKARPWSEGKYCRYGGDRDVVPLGRSGKVVHAWVDTVTFVDKVKVTFPGSLWTVDPSELSLSWPCDEVAVVGDSLPKLVY